MNYKLKSFETAISVTKIANIHYFEFIRQYHTFKDCHDFCELIYVDNGSINIDSENFKGTLSQNQIIIHKAGEEHSLSCTDNIAPNVIIIGFECNCEALDIFSYKKTSLSKECIKLLTDIIKEGRNVFVPPYDIPNLKDMKKKKDYPFGADQMIKLKLETFLIELVRSSESTSLDNKNDIQDLKMADIYKYITLNFRMKITLDELCFLYGTNKTSLCHDFKATYNDSIINFINKLKIKEAKKLLREGNYNLTQIASILGISSVHYLSRLFKSLEGVSPSCYMKTIKSKLEN